VYQHSRGWVDVLIPLRPIWSRVFGVMRFRDGSDKGITPIGANLGESAKETLAKSELTEIGKIETSEEQSQEHAHRFL
jgi:hypothetical protein